MKILFGILLGMASLWAVSLSDLTLVGEDEVDMLVFDIKKEKNVLSAISKLKEKADLGEKKAIFAYATIVENIKPEDSIKYYKVSIEKRDFRAANNLGLFYLRQGDTDNAIKYLKIAHDNGITAAAKPLAVLTQDLSLLVEGVKNEDFESAQLTLYIMRENNDSRFMKVSEEFYKKQLDYVNYAEIILTQGDLDKAINVLNKGVTARDTASILALAELYSKDKPEKTFEILKMVPNNIEFYRISGMAFYNMKEYKGALDNFRLYKSGGGVQNVNNYIDKICSVTNYCLNF